MAKLPLAWNYQWMKAIEENLFLSGREFSRGNANCTTLQLLGVQGCFVATCQQLFQEILFNLSIPIQFRRLLQLDPAIISTFDPVLAALVASEGVDPQVFVYYEKKILFKLVLRSTTPTGGAGGQNIVKQFKEEFDRYNQLNEDIFNILSSVDEYFPLRVPQCCFFSHTFCVVVCTAIESLQMTFLTSTGRVPSLQFEEHQRLKREINPAAAAPGLNKQTSQTLFTQADISASKTEDTHKQSITRNQIGEEDLKYVEMLQSMMRDANGNSVTLKGQNGGGSYSITSAISTNECQRTVAVSDILKKLKMFRESQQSKKEYLNKSEEGGEELQLYLADTTNFEGFREFSSQESSPLPFPRNLSVSFILFCLAPFVKQQVRDPRILSQTVAVEGTLTSIIKGQVRSIVKSLQELQVIPATMEEFEDLLGKSATFTADATTKKTRVAIACELLLTIGESRLPFVREQVIAFLLSHIIKPMFRSQMKKRAIFFRTSIQQVIQRIEELKEAIKVSVSDLRNGEARLKEIKNEIKVISIQQTAHFDSLHDTSRLEQLQQVAEGLTEKFAKMKLEHSRLQSEYHHLTEGDSDLQRNAAEQASFKGYSFLLKDKSPQSFSLTICLRDIQELPSPTVLNLKYQFFMDLSVREFIERLEEDDEFWRSEIVPQLLEMINDSQQPPLLLMSVRGKEVAQLLEKMSNARTRREVVPYGFLLQKVSEKVGFFLKPMTSLQGRGQEQNGLRSENLVKNFVETKAYENRMTPLSKVINCFEESIRNGDTRTAAASLEAAQLLLGTLSDRQQRVEAGFNIEIEHRRLKEAISNRQVRLMFETGRLEELVKQAPVLLASLSPLHITTLQSLQLVFSAQITLGYAEKAHTTINAIQTLLDFNFGNGCEHLLLLSSGLEDLASYFIKKKQFSRGVELYQQCDRICMLNLGYNHPKTAFCSSVLGELALRNGDLELALSMYRKALDQYSDHEESHYKTILAVRLKITEIFIQMKDHQKAYEAAEEGLSYYQQRSRESDVKRDAIKSMDTMFLRLAHYALQTLLARNDFSLDRVSQQANAFWTAALLVGEEEHSEIIAESLLISIILMFGGIANEQTKNGFKQLMHTHSLFQSQALTATAPLPEEKTAFSELLESFELFEDLINEITREVEQFSKACVLRPSSIIMHAMQQKMSKFVWRWLGEKNVGLLVAYDFEFNQFI